MTAPEISAEVEASCRRLVVAFAHHLDHRRFPEVAALFTPAGVWHRRGHSMRGPTEILDFLQQRPASVVELHVMSTIHVEQSGPTTCTATSYATIYRGARDGDELPPLPAPDAIGVFEDRLELTDLGWRIAYRSSRPTFRGGAAP